MVRDAENAKAAAKKAVPMPVVGRATLGELLVALLMADLED